MANNIKKLKSSEWHPDDSLRLPSHCDITQFALRNCNTMHRRSWSLVNAILVINMKCQVRRKKLVKPINWFTHSSSLKRLHCKPVLRYPATSVWKLQSMFFFNFFCLDSMLSLGRPLLCSKLYTLLLIEATRKRVNCKPNSVVLGKRFLLCTWLCALAALTIYDYVACYLYCWSRNSEDGHSTSG